jgi:hypothetical protein
VNPLILIIFSTNKINVFSRARETLL